MGSSRSWRTVLIAFAAILAITGIEAVSEVGVAQCVVLKVCVTEIDIENELH